MFADLDRTAFDEKAFSMDEGIGQLSPCRIVNTGNCRPRYIHLDGTLFLCLTDQIDEADYFVFIDGHDDGSRIGCTVWRRKFPGCRQGTYAAAPRRSRHRHTPFRIPLRPL